MFCEEEMLMGISIVSDGECQLEDKPQIKTVLTHQLCEADFSFNRIRKEV